MSINRKKTICVLRNRWHFGAQILTIPALFYIKKNSAIKNPIEISIISKQDTNWFYSQFNWIDNFFIQGGFFSDLKLIYKSEKLVSFQPSSYRYLFLSLLARIDENFGFSKKRFLNRLWKKSIEFNPSVYRGLHYLQLASVEDGIDNTELMNHLRLPFIKIASTSDLIINSCNQDDTLNVCIMPGGGAGEFKKWGVKNFFESAKLLAFSKNKSVVLHWLVGPDEIEEKKSIDFLVNNSTLINEKLSVTSFLYTDLKIKDIAALVSQVDITIANDCGPAHVAQCMQQGFIGIFDQTKPEWFLVHTASKCVVPNKENTDEKYPILSISPTEVNKAILSII